MGVKYNEMIRNYVNPDSEYLFIYKIENSIFFSSFPNPIFYSDKHQNFG